MDPETSRARNDQPVRDRERMWKGTPNPEATPAAAPSHQVVESRNRSDARQDLVYLELLLQGAAVDASAAGLARSQHAGLATDQYGRMMAEGAVGGVNSYPLHYPS